MNPLDDVEEIARLTAEANNMFGPLPGWVRDILVALVLDPTQQTWEQAYSLMISEERFMTLWKAVQVVDPEFQTVRAFGRHWDYVPDRDTIMRAIACATSPIDEP